MLIVVRPVPAAAVMLVAFWNESEVVIVQYVYTMPPPHARYCPFA